MKLAIIGAGYVGLTSAACLSELNHSVMCIDVDAARIAALETGGCPIHEAGLPELLKANRAAGRLRFTTDLDAVGDADVVFLAVGTPTLASGDIDLSYVEEAAQAIAPKVRSGATIVVKSTVVAGTCRRLREIVAEARGGLDFAIASNPEFLREGSAVEDFLWPDRVVLGTDDPRTCDVLNELYAPLAERGAPLICTTTTNAELIKYASNAMLALRIGFINEVADLCEQVAGDVEVVARGVGSDSRIGPDFLRAGPGFGGSCFPKDTRAFAATGRRHGTPMQLIDTLIAANGDRRRRLTDQVLDALGPNPKGKVVAVLGLAFKAGTDDMREAMSTVLVPTLQAAGVHVRAYDPYAAQHADRVLPGIQLVSDPLEACEDADAAVMLTPLPEVAAMHVAHLARTLRGNLVFDYQNLLSPAALSAAGLNHIGIGRPPVMPERSGASKARPSGHSSITAMEG